MSYYHLPASRQEMRRVRSFAEAEATYNSIAPINGKCRPKSMDIRPIGKRYRHWERIIKVSDDEYALSVGNLHHVSYYRNETIVVRYTWWSAYLGAFYEFSLPMGIHIKTSQAHAKKYLTVDGNHYRLTASGVTLEIAGGRWQVKDPVTERIPRIDKNKTAEIREMLEPFWEYCTTWWPIAPAEPSPYTWGRGRYQRYRHPVIGADGGTSGWADWFSPGPENSERWLKLFNHYKNVRARTYTVADYSGTTSKCTQVTPGLAEVRQMLLDDTYRMACPFKYQEVPIGEIASSKWERIAEAGGKLR